MAPAFVSLPAWILGTSVAAVGGAVTAKEAQRFYNQLDRPPWAPPDWLFGPAWTVLYGLMGTAAWRVWRAEGFEGAGGTFVLYAVQLAFNAAWSWFFFVRKSGLWSTIEVCCLLALVIVTGVAFAIRDTIAGLLFVPYVIWVSYATALTISVWMRNPAQLEGRLFD